MGNPGPERQRRFEKLLFPAAQHFSAIIERYWYIPALFITVGYFSDTVFRASRKLFWFDEIFTVYLARLPDWKSLWHVLLAGVDFNPPVLYILTRFSNSILGESQVSARLPEIIGFWIFCWCLLRFVWRRSSALGGLISMMFPMITLAYWYAYEARPYGIELAFCGIALLCWQAAADRDSARLGWLLGLGIGLAGGLLSHGYGFLVFLPLTLGEVARTFERRRMDWPVWITIAISSAAVLVLIPESRALKAIVIPGTVNHASMAALVANYIAYLKPAAYVAIGWLALMCFQGVKIPIQVSAPGRNPRLYETLALLAFLAVPACQALVAWLTGAPPIARYSICWIAGPACLLGLASARRPVVALGTLLLIVAQFGVNALKFKSGSILTEPSVAHPISTSLPAFRQRYRWMQEANNQTLPIALLNQFDFLPTAFYAPGNLVPRLTYVMPSKADLNGVFYERLRVCCGAVLGSPAYLSDFLASHETFLAFGGPLELPILNELLKGGASIVVRNISSDYFLVCVTRSKNRYLCCVSQSY